MEYKSSILRPSDLPEGLEPSSSEALRYASRLIAQSFEEVTICSIALNAAAFEIDNPEIEAAICIHTANRLKECAECLGAADSLMD